LQLRHLPLPARHIGRVPGENALISSDFSTFPGVRSALRRETPGFNRQGVIATCFDVNALLARCDEERRCRGRRMHIERSDGRVTLYRAHGIAGK
jgi:hypothetical protein